ncbi:MAG: HK97 family phage prohead protease [Nitrosopumilus sp.]|nr:HK97 family phage prohead protease [Nitrosopumilus sp.]
MDKFFITTDEDISVTQKEFNDKERSFVAYASKEVVDRDGEVIKADAWNLDEYKKNPIILLFHDYSRLPVGTAMWTKTNANGLLFKPKFADTEAGREVYQLYKEGALNAFSVGFQPLEWEEVKGKTVKRIYNSVKLLEISCVSIPSCPDALVERVNSGAIKTKALDSALKEIIAINKPEPEETENEIRVRLKNPSEFEKDSFRRITVKKDKPKVFGIIGKLKGKTATSLQSYRFPKSDGWTKEKAVKWADDHPIKSYTEATLKGLSLGGLMSIFDIMEKIRAELMRTPEGERHVYIEDIFPNTPTSGSCIIGFDAVINDTSSKYWHYDYSYSRENDSVTLTDPVAVEEVYVRKSYRDYIDAIGETEEVIAKAGRELSGKNITLLKSVSSKMSEASTMINSLVEGKEAEPEVVKQDDDAQTKEIMTEEQIEDKNHDTISIDDVKEILSGFTKKVSDQQLSADTIKDIVNSEIKRSLGILD